MKGKLLTNLFYRYVSTNINFIIMILIFDMFLLIIISQFYFVSFRSNWGSNFQEIFFTFFEIFAQVKGIPEFLDSGRKCWTLDSKRWTLDTGLWTLESGSWTLHFRRWALDTGHCRWLFQNRIRTQFLILLD